MTLYEIATGQPRRTFGHKLTPAVKDDLPDDMYYTPYYALPQAKSEGNFALSPDGRLLALAGADGSIPVLDAFTGKELAHFRGHTGVVNALAFAPDGKTLVSASADTTALVWDVSKLKRLTAAAKAPSPAELTAWWQALADSDSGKAFAVMGDFVAAPNRPWPFSGSRSNQPRCPPRNASRNCSRNWTTSPSRYATGPPGSCLRSAIC